MVSKTTVSFSMAKRTAQLWILPLTRGGSPAANVSTKNVLSHGAAGVTADVKTGVAKRPSPQNVDLTVFDQWLVVDDQDVDIDDLFSDMLHQGANGDVMAKQFEFRLRARRMKSAQDEERRPHHSSAFRPSACS
jgi:hypothetical protein